MTLSGATRLAAVIGDPIRHSRSPAIFNAASTCSSVLPIMNSPGGIRTIFMPTLLVVSTSMPRCLAQAS